MEPAIEIWDLDLVCIHDELVRCWCSNDLQHFWLGASCNTARLTGTVPLFLVYKQIKEENPYMVLGGRSEVSRSIRI